MENICVTKCFKGHIHITCQICKLWKYLCSNMNKDTVFVKLIFCIFCYVLYCHCVRRKEPVIGGGVELCSYKLPVSSSEESPEYNHPAGKSGKREPFYLFFFSLLKLALCVCLCVCVRSTPCLVSLSLCSTPVKQRSL